MWFQEELVSDEEIIGAEVPVVQQQSSVGTTLPAAEVEAEETPTSPAAEAEAEGSGSSSEHKGSEKNRKRKAETLEGCDEAELGQFVVKSISKVLAKGLDKL